MTVTLDNLIPFKKEHSISEAVFSFFLPNKILDPHRFETLLKPGEPFAELFQSFKVLEGFQIGMNLQPQNVGEVKTDFKKTGDDGFQFESYREGALDWLVRYGPNQRGPVALSFHSLNYPGWQDFYDKVFKFISGIVQIDNSIYAQAYSLNYIDQFDWIGDSFPPNEQIFNSNSKYIPQLIFEIDKEWNYSTTNIRKVGAQNITENINIGVEFVVNNKYNLYIIHHVASMFEEIKNLREMCEGREDLKKSANSMHDLNKIFLKDLLTTEVLTKINIPV